MRASRREENGSFRERMDDLVPLLGSEDPATSRDPDEAPDIIIGARGSIAYRINQYLFERSRH